MKSLNKRGFVSVSVIYSIMFAILVGLSVVTINYISKRNAIDEVNVPETPDEPSPTVNGKVLFNDYLKSLVIYDSNNNVYTSSISHQGSCQESAAKLERCGTSTNTTCNNLKSTVSHCRYRFIKMDSLSIPKSGRYVNGTVPTSGVYNAGYRYQGKDPDNYISFNGTLWRIIGIIGSDGHGKVGKMYVKIVKDVNTNDDITTNEPQFLEYNKRIDGQIPELRFCDYTHSDLKKTLDNQYEALNSTYKNMVVADAKWHISGIKSYTDTTVSDIYYAEIMGQYCDTYTDLSNTPNNACDNDGNSHCAGCKHAYINGNSSRGSGYYFTTISNFYDGDEPVFYYNDTSNSVIRNAYNNLVNYNKELTGITLNTSERQQYNVKYFPDFEDAISIIYPSDYLLSILSYSDEDVIPKTNLSIYGDNQDLISNNDTFNTYLREPGVFQYMLGTHWAIYPGPNQLYRHYADRCAGINGSGGINAYTSNNSGTRSDNNTRANIESRPTMYLKDDIYYVSGDGSKANPFVVTQ